MKIVLTLFSVMLLICLPVTGVYGDYLEVRRSANIRAEPNSDARVIERVESGIHLELLDEGRQTNGYYSVRTVSLGQSGWIYRSLVRRYPGEIPEPPPEGRMLDPIRDPTEKNTA